MDLSNDMGMGDCTGANRRPSFQHLFRPHRRPSTVFLKDLRIQQDEHEQQMAETQKQKALLDIEEGSQSMVVAVASRRTRQPAGPGRKQKGMTATSEVLRARAEEYQLNGEMKQFRDQHQLRLGQIEHQKLLLRQYKQQLKQRIDDNGKFVAEQFNKQMRAEVKYREEHRAVSQLNRELSALNQQADQLDIRLQLISDQIEKCEPYRDILWTCAKLTAGGTAGGGQTCEAEMMNFIQKHQTLKQTNIQLRDTLTSKNQELERVQKMCDEVANGHEIDRLNSMLQLDTLQTSVEAMRNRNQSQEQLLFYSGDKFRQELIDKGKILQAIKNLMERCNSKHFKPIKSSECEDTELTYTEMLHHIQEFIAHEYDVILKSRHIGETEQLLTDSNTHTQRKHRQRQDKLSSISSSVYR